MCMEWNVNEVNQIISTTNTQHVISAQTWAIGQDNENLLGKGTSRL